MEKAKTNPEFKAKINKAFQDLRKQGMFARQSFLCCQNCAWSEIQSTVDITTGKYTGIIFYHKQDAEDLPRGRVFIAFSSTGGHALGTLRVGNLVKQAFLDAGLEVEWNGKVDTRILVRDAST